MSPFFVSRNIGLRWNRTAAAERMTLSLGVFNDWLTTAPTFEDSGTTVSGRVTGLAWISPWGRRFLHLAGAFRRNGADEGQLRFKGRPESNVTDYYVDTGNIPASHANQYGLEALWNEGPVSLTAEYDESHVDSPKTGDPQFRGYYVTGSWVLTGEHRPYDRKVRLRVPHPAHQPVGGRGADRAVWDRRPRRQDGPGRQPHQVVRRRELVGQPAHPHQRGLWPRDPGPARHDRPHQPVLNARAVGLLTGAS